MPRWIPLAQVADCPPGESLELLAEGRIVALFNVNGTFYALDGVCPHQGGPLGKGNLQVCLVQCPWHGCEFDVRDGQSQINPQMKQPCFGIRIESGTVWVDLE